MRVILVFIVVIFTSESLVGQIRKPVYKSVADSVRLVELEQKIDNLLRNEIGTPPRIIDSLRQELRNLYEKSITGYRYYYLPQKDFTSYSELENGKVLPSDVKKISLSDYKETKMPRLLYACNNLEQLELIDTRIKRLPRKLNRLKHLSRVSIYNNRPKDRLKISPNKNITTLVLRGEDPEKIPMRFGALRSLDTLDLKRNNLNLFPSIEKNKHLRQLILAENNLTLKDLSAKNRSTSLLHLGLQKNKIESVPDAIGNFPKLKKLVLNYNKIADLPQGISRLKDLEELALYSNALKKIPEPVYSLGNLMFLDLYFNEIERIENKVSRLNKLSILYIASNRIYSISDSIGELRNLRELYIHHNRLSLLPAAIAKLTDLEIFRFNANQMVEVPEWVTRLQKLRYIDMAQNKVYKTPRCLEQLPELENVSMTENPWENKNDVHDLADALTMKGIVVHLEDDRN